MNGRKMCGEAVREDSRRKKYSNGRIDTAVQPRYSLTSVGVYVCYDRGALLLAEEMNASSEIVTTPLDTTVYAIYVSKEPP